MTIISDSVASIKNMDLMLPPSPRIVPNDEMEDKHRSSTAFPSNVLSNTDSTDNFYNNKNWVEYYPTNEMDCEHQSPDDLISNLDCFPLLPLIKNEYSPTFASLLISPESTSSVFPNDKIRQYHAAIMPNVSKLPGTENSKTTTTIGNKKFPADVSILSSRHCPDEIKSNKIDISNSIAVTTPTNKCLTEVGTHPIVINSKNGSHEYHTSSGAGCCRGDNNAVCGKIVQRPTNCDVLFGRGGRSNNHKGNQRYLKELNKRKKLYRTKSKFEKTIMSQQVVDHVHNYGGRFLKKDNKSGTWCEVPNDQARKKVSQGLRERTTIKKQKRNQNKKKSIRRQND